MTWIKYLLEANLYLVLFYALYYLLLRRETHYQLNRFYLLGSILLSFATPLLQLGFLRPAPIVIENISSPIVPDVAVNHQKVVTTTYTVVSPVMNIAAANIPAEPVNYYLIAYFTVALIMTVALILRIYQLTKLARLGKHTIANQVKLIELEDNEHAFSFFSYLFISKKFTSSATIIQHELVHIRQKHSLDIMLIELVKIICWFNPVIYLMQNSIKELHEYIADNKIATAHQDVNYYTDFLISNAYGLPELAITNNFFTKNLLKKRIMMLHQKRSGNAARLKYLVALPLLVGMLCASTLAFTKDYPVYDLAPKLSANETAKSNKEKKAKVIKSQTLGKVNLSKYVIALPMPIPEVKLVRVAKTEISTANADTLFGPKSPLYVIDDVPLTRKNAGEYGYDPNLKGTMLAEVPQEHIFKTEILKDAAAIKLYGSKAKNGVVKITTFYAEVVAASAADAKIASQYPLLYIDDIKQTLPQDLKLTATENIVAAVREKVPAELIKSMDVITGKTATDAYGAKATRGVIKIKTFYLPPTEGLIVKAYPGIDSQPIRDFLTNSGVKYPAKAQRDSTYGQTLVTFTVGSDYKVNDVVIKQSLTEEINNEIKRALTNQTVPKLMMPGYHYSVLFVFVNDVRKTFTIVDNGVPGTISLPMAVISDHNGNTTTKFFRSL